MRLIDADALMELIKDHEKNLVYNITHSKTKGITKSRDFIRGVEDGYYRVFSDLKQMPTIEAELKHGRWIVNNETEEWVTIYCGQCHDGMWNRKGDPYPNYCFNCGARMDEVEE